MFARARTSWARRHGFIGRPIGMLDTVTGGATMAATSGFDHVPRCTEIVVAAQSAWAMAASIG
jgi:hypothetical protein